MGKNQGKLDILAGVIDKIIQQKIRLGWHFYNKFLKDILDLNEGEDFSQSFYIDEIEDIDLKCLAYYIKGLKSAKGIIKNNLKNTDKKIYLNNCWNCGHDIDNRISPQCEKCGWYICNNCGSCEISCTGQDADTLREALEIF